MKKTYLYLATAGLSCGMIIPAFASMTVLANFKNKSSYFFTTTATCSKVNDDATFSAFAKNYTITGQSTSSKITMGNSSFFPRGVGVECTFSIVGCPGITETFYLDDPAVGAHSYSWTKSGSGTCGETFSLAESTNSDDNYTYTITGKATTT